MVDSNSINQTSSSGGTSSVSTGEAQQTPSGNPAPMDPNANVAAMGLSEFEKKYPELAEKIEEQMVWEMGKKQQQSLQRMKEERKKNEQGG